MKQISNVSLQMTMSAQQPGLPSNAMWPSSVPVYQEPGHSSLNFCLTSSRPAAMATAAELHGQHVLAAAFSLAMEIRKFLPPLSVAVIQVTTTI